MNPIKIGKVERYLLDRINKDGAVHITLIDPEKTTPDEAVKITKNVKKAGSVAVMVGGSTIMETKIMDEVILALKQIGLPIIIFPNNLAAISRYADAIWFMSLLNSISPYFIIGAQCLAAPIIKKYNIETIPMAYIIVGEGGAAATVGQALPLSFDHPEIILSYALAAQYLGMRFVYLEAGSGAKKPVPPSIISLIKKNVSLPLIIGGGINAPEAAFDAVKAGADIIVTGTLVEKGNIHKLTEVINKIKTALK
jgi:phosphoglycerol geranylgeranyltransferase